MKRNTFKEMKAIIDALEQGKVIQRCYDEENDKWEDIVTFPNFGYSTYRIKPGEPKKRWRPFKNTAELFAHNNGRDILWLTEQSNSEKRLVTSYGSDYVRFLTCRYNMEELFNDFTFADGTRCGVLEEDA